MQYLCKLYVEQNQINSIRYIVSEFQSNTKRSATQLQVEMNRSQSKKEMITELLTTKSQ